MEGSGIVGLLGKNMEELKSCLLDSKSDFRLLKKVESYIKD